MAGENNPEEKLSQEGHEDPKGYFEFNTLTAEQREKLRTHIEQHEGLLRVFVHPTFDLFPNQEPQEPDTKHLTIFSKLIKREKAGAPPILILEDERDIGLLRDILQRAQGVIKNEPYLIKTVAKTPYPLVEGAEKIDWEKGYTLRPEDKDFSVELEYYNSSLGNLIRSLMDLGVKRILVGGSNLVFNDKRQAFEQCVANFMDGVRKFSNGSISMDVSEATAPLSGGEFRKIMRENGQM